MKILDIKESLLKKHFAKKQKFKMLATKEQYAFITKNIILIKGLFKFRQNLGLLSPNSRHQVK